MNRVYRVIWCTLRGAFVVVSERAKGKTKSGRSRVRSAAQLLLIGVGSAGVSGLTLAEQPVTTVVPVPGKTNVFLAPNGVPVVNINTANSAGVSHNKYSKYNVEANGLVLNNGNSSQISRQSVLAGQVMANLNLGAEATLILNEVVAPNRSLLAGYTEVLGGKADVVVANPYGITCSGCGFINTDRATLTTGTPKLNSNGSLQGFSVREGDVRVQGKGLDASGQQLLDLVSRSVVVDAQINTAEHGELAIVAGANNWDYGTRTVSGQNATTSAAPAYAIDSSALGGMYAGRIRLLATEAGVGVRMRGEAAASVDDFTLSSRGTIELSNKISAERDLALTAEDRARAAISLTDTELSAKRNLTLASADGGAQLIGGVLTAGETLGYQVNALSDTQSSATLRDNNKRFAKRVDLQVTDAAQLSGVSYGAADELSAEVGSLAVDASEGATLYSSDRLELTADTDLALNTAAVRASGDMALTATTGTITISAGAQQGVQSDQGALSLSAQQALNNAGVVSAAAGALTVKVDGRIDNSGTLHANGALKIGGLMDAAVSDVSNSGTLISDGAMTLTATTLSNAGLVQAAQGSDVDVRTLSNQGQWIAASEAGYSTRFYVDSLFNGIAGIIQSAADLDLEIRDRLRNEGLLLAEQNLRVAAADPAVELALDNLSSGVMQAGQLLQVAGSAGASNVAVANQGGKILANQVVLTVAQLDNGGTLQSRNGMQITSDTGVTNSGTLLAQTALSLAASHLDNTGTLQADQGASITVDTLSNDGILIASTESGYSATFTLNRLVNAVNSMLQSRGDLTLNLRDALDNRGQLQSDANLSIQASGADTLTVNNEASGLIQAGQELAILGFGGGSNTLMTTQFGALLADRLHFKLTSLVNQGVIQGGSGASQLDIQQTLDNRSGALLHLATAAGGRGTIQANAISNRGTLQSTGDATLRVADTLNNEGLLLGGAGLTLSGSDSQYQLSNSGRIQSAGALLIEGQGGSQGVDLAMAADALLLAGTLEMNANTLILADNAMLSSTGNMAVTANSLSFGGTRARIVAATTGGQANVRLSNGFTNVGAVHSGGSMYFSAPTISNTDTGGFSALDTLVLEATAGSLSNNGSLYAGNQLTATARDHITNTGSQARIDSDGSISLTAGGTFTNNSSINARENISISSNSFRNEVTGGVPERRWSSITWGDTVKTSQNGSWGWPNDSTAYYERTGYRTEYFVTSPTDPKPQIIAGGDMAITGFTSAKNTGAVLAASAGTLTIDGSGTFTNDDLSLKTEYYKETWNVYENCGLVDCDSKVERSRTKWVTNTTTARSYGAGIFAQTLNASGFSLHNQSSAWQADTQQTSQSGTGTVGLSDSQGHSAGASGVSGTASVNGVPAVSFGGLVIELPTNPNGYFVTNKSPQAEYLVETNPLFAVGSDFVGSNYLANRYGYNPDDIQKRLGDANYEGYLIRQQLIEQTGNNLLQGYAKEAEQMKSLMDNAVAEGQRLGLEFGKAPSADQLAGLTRDIVWMVETVVAGQRVLAPVVYLAPSTRERISKGAVIAADEIDMDLESLDNEGGTIAGGDKLSITAKNDITNTGGTIKGGDVSLESTEGSIINQTRTRGDGNKESYNTTLGKTGGIESTGDLNLTAHKDIKVVGADIKAGGDAALDAGGDISFDTIVDKTRSTTRSSSSGLFQSSSTTTTTTTERNIGSNLQAGGNLKLSSGGDTTIAGSAADVGGNLSVETGGDFNVLARQDKTTTHSETSTSGMGVGGGLYGEQKVTTDAFVGSNKGSTLNVGGNAEISAKGDMTLQGSEMTVAGDGVIDATNVNILDGLDEEYSKTVTETTAYLSTSSSKADADAPSSSSESASSGRRATANASAEAAAETGNNSELNLVETTVETTIKNKTTSVGSTLSFGGDATITAKETLTLQGSELEAGGDLSLQAEDVEVLAGRNTEYESTTTKTTKVGFFSDSNAGSGAAAEANATGMSANANASAEAGASADSTLTMGVRTVVEQETSNSVTHSSSVIKSGGNMSINAGDTAKFVGADVEAGGNLEIAAKNITNEAARDTYDYSSSSTTTTAGLYIGAEANADANAGAKATPTANAGAEGETSVEATGGLRLGIESESSREGSVTHVTNSFSAGGNITRTAEETIRDQGTSMAAGGNIDQSANRIIEEAVHDESYSSASSSSHEARLGVYAGAGAEASQDGAEGSGSAGIQGSYANEYGREGESSKTAVTSSYSAGGSISSSSKEETVLVGTSFDAGGDIELNAGSLEFKAAENSSSKNASSSAVDASGKVALYGEPGAELSGAYEQQKERETGTEAQVGSLNAGGSIKVNARDDVRFEGTDIGAEQDVSISSEQGSVSFDAAKSTTTTSADGFNVSASLSASSDEASGELGGGFNQASSDSTTSTVANIRSGSGNIKVTAKDSVTLEGTTVDSSGSTQINAREVKLLEAKDSSSDSSVSLQAEAGLSKEEQSGGVNVQASGGNKEKGKGVSIAAGGKLEINAEQVTDQEAKLSGKDGVGVTGEVTKLKKTDKESGYAIEVDLEGKRESKKEKPKSGSKTVDNADLGHKRDKVSDSKPRSKEEGDTPASAQDGKTRSREEEIQDLKNAQRELDQKMKKPRTKANSDSATKPETRPGNQSGVPSDVASERPSGTRTAADGGNRGTAQGNDSVTPAQPAKQRSTYMDSTVSSRAKMRERVVSEPPKGAPSQGAGAGKSTSGATARPKADTAAQSVPSYMQSTESSRAKITTPRSGTQP